MPLTPPQADLLHDENNGEWVYYDQRGVHGTRVYRVKTQNRALAILADGLPRVGDNWEEGDPVLGSMVCTKVGPAERLGGKQHPDGTEDGWCRVPCEYTSDLGTIILPAESDQWTEIQANVGTLQIINSVTGKVLCNGEGAGAESGFLTARVFTHFGATKKIDVPRLLSLMNLPVAGQGGVNTLNDRPITLPPIFRTGHTINLDIAQARYRSFEVNEVNGLAQVIHTLALAQDWKVRWYGIGVNGLPKTSDVHKEDIYPLADWSGLWKGI